MVEREFGFQADKFFVHRDIDPRASYVDSFHAESQSDLPEINLAEGVTVSPPPELDAIIKELASSGAFLDSLRHYDAVSIEPTVRNIRNRFNLSDNPYVVVSGGGSHEILERLVHLLHQPSKVRRIFGISPHFPEPTNFVKKLSTIDSASQLIYGPVNIPLESSAVEGLEIAKKRRKDIKFKRVTYYLCNPNTPKGDIASREDVRDFIEFCAENGDLVVVDEAFRARDEDSAIPDTEDYPNLIVLDSFSKKMGVPNLRGGYAVASRDIGPYYEEMRRVFDISGPQALILNEISRPDIIVPHQERTLPEQVELKRYLMRRLDEEGIGYLPTSEMTPIITVDGKVDHFVTNLDRLNVRTAKGWGFYATEPRAGRRQPMGSRYARVSTPSTKKLIDTAVNRMKSAKISLPI